MIARKGLHGAAALVVATLATASIADARCASRFYVGESEGIFATTTGIAARSDWRGQVSENIGSNFALWSRAINKSTRCTRREGGGRWFCRARAVPCSD
ncbi:MAG: hypothetical protein J2P50_00085 [Hyphomicrobiaceae bacterium]|nr:hypothetical protein [Hyphomicrobiaceae bacterium]